MATNFVFEITNLTSDINTGVVLSVEFSIKAESDEGLSSRGLTDVLNLLPPGESFLDFSSLTPELVVDWIREQLHPDKLSYLKELLETDLNLLKNPKVKTLLPWSVVNA
jgi:hypothetical protein